VSSAAFVSTRCRRIAIACAALLAALACSATPARADGGGPIPATCSTFGSALTSANPGDTIVLTGLCTGAQAHFILPATAGLTIEGAATGTNGFDGTALGATPALKSPGSGVNGITIANLTFENYTAISALMITSPSVVTRPFIVSHDTFTGDTNPPGGTDEGGGLYLVMSSTACAPIDVTLSDSVFSGDTTAWYGGGGFIATQCSTGSNAMITVTGNVFTHDHVAQVPDMGGGGGLAVVAFFTPINVTQAGNVFDSDSVTNATPLHISGGGELTVGANVTSTGDSFTNDTLTGPASSNTWSWGGGLATYGGRGCTTPGSATSQFTNLVAAGNSIGAPSGSGTNAGALGAGIYAGCSGASEGYNLTLVNSTVSGNTAPGTGAVAGVGGETVDVLNLRNTIVAGDTGGAELGGFGVTTAANATATFSDVCAVGSSSTPFTGAGNICAAPALAGASTGDVHETAASPTIDAGSAALVPAGVTTDAYGNPRALAGRTGDGAVVDIGAAEFPAPPTPPSAPVNTGAPAVTGTPTLGATLTCSTGTWTGSPTAYHYAWSRDGTPITGATQSAYVVQAADQGHELACIVTAANGAGAGAGAASAAVTLPPAAPACRSATGRLSGATLGLIALGATRSRANAAYAHRSDRGRRYEEFFCLDRIGVRAGFASPKLLRPLDAAQRRAVRGRVVWVSTANPFYALRGVRPGDSLAVARSHLKLGQAFHVGANDWYFVPGSRSNGLIKVRRGTVAEIGIATRSVTLGRRAQRRFLTSFS
jgi:hypothetical protein